MLAKSGHALLAAGARDAVRERMLPLATVVTPNLPEAAELAGVDVPGRGALRETARRVHELGPDWVLLKGGHLAGEPVDVLFDGREFIEITRPRIDTPHTHGTGCTYSAAIATLLGRGLDVPDAVAQARDALQRAIEQAPGLGGGHGPLNHRVMWGTGVI
jgi:hydroxymethylpyrimidine/phosphomethylpyrimidine kinase